jgi:hypothetical protein
MQRPPPPPPRGAGAPPPPPPPFRGAAAAISKAPVSAAVTASTVASSLLDPRGVASLPLRLPEEIAAPPVAAAPPPALAPAKAPHAVLYPFPAPRGDGSQSRVLARVLAAHTAASSSAAHMAAHEAAMAGLGRRARAARTLKRRADDARVQQLRGIFAGHDSDRDGIVGDKCVRGARGAARPSFSFLFRSRVGRPPPAPHPAAAAPRHTSPPACPCRRCCTCCARWTGPRRWPPTRRPTCCA